MKRHLSTYLLAVLLAALLSACGRSDAPDGAPASTNTDRATTAAALPPTELPAAGPALSATVQPAPTTATTEPELIASKQKRVQPPARTTRTPALVGGINGFAFDLYRTVGKEKQGNLIYSPYSIALAFSMVYAGARGETEAQMADVLGFLPQGSQHPAANALERHLATLGAGAPPPGEQQGEAFKLRTANAVWGQRGFPFLDAYLQTLAAHYGAGVRATDFGADPEGARKLVNDWVADQTEERIKDIVPPGVIDAQTRLVLANAIYFKAAWLYPFEEGATKEGQFTLLDGSKVTVPMMRQDLTTVPYAAGKDYQTVVLPYTGQTVEMVIVVPEAGRFKDVEARLSADFLKGVRAASETRGATVTMPRFDFESEFDLTQILPGMGMPDAFGGADFSGIAEGGGLSISAAIHRATIAADEKGAEAAAATVIAIAGSAQVMTPPHLTINRPFIFAIVERETGAILFLGRVTNPAS